MGLPRNTVIAPPRPGSAVMDLYCRKPDHQADSDAEEAEGLVLEVPASANFALGVVAQRGAGACGEAWEAASPSACASAFDLH